MFHRHVTKKLSAYCHGELDADESSRVGEHLSRCAGCRAEKEEIELGIHLAERLPQVPAPASLWSEIEASLDKSSDKQEVKPKTRRLLVGRARAHSRDRGARRGGGLSRGLVCEARPTRSRST